LELFAAMDVIMEDPPPAKGLDEEAILLPGNEGFPPPPPVLTAPVMGTWA
jgi:hypothetical protein